VIPKESPHNKHHRPIRTMVKDGSIWPSMWENDMVHNYTCDLSMSDHFAPPTTTLF